MKKRILVGLFACTLSSQVFGFGRNSDVEQLVESYKEELSRLGEIEDGKAKERKKVIGTAKASVVKLNNTLTSYNKSLRNYQDRYITPMKARIERNKTESENLRQKISEYEKGLEQAVKEQRFGKKGIFGKKYGAADYKNFIDDAKESLVEAEKKKTSYEASLKSYEQQKKEYEGSIAKKKDELIAAQKSFGQAEDGLKVFREESKEHLGSSVTPSLHLAVGQMIQNGKNASLEAELMLRDLDNLATKLGVSKAELQNVFAANPELRQKMGNTAIGGYVNSQIANAMGSVCEYQTMCAAKGADDVNKLSPEIVKKSLDHLNDKQRGAKVIEAMGEKVERDVAAEGATLGK